MLDFMPHSRQFTPTPVLKMTGAVMLPVGNTPLYKNIDFMPSGKQSRCWRGPGFRQQVCCGWSHFFIQVIKYFADHLRIFDAGKSLPRERSECFGYNPDVTTAFTTGFTTKSRRPEAKVGAFRRYRYRTPASTVPSWGLLSPEGAYSWWYAHWPWWQPLHVMRNQQFQPRGLKTGYLIRQAEFAVYRE